MKRAFCLINIFLSCTLLIDAQALKGRITNESGDAIPYATIYIQELKQGTTTNIKGDYEINLPAGNYQVTFQSLGYSPVFYNLTFSGQDVLKNVVLPLQYYQIPEVRISATNEDPAYGIMRKTVGMAPYYLNCVSHYNADVYLKGNMVFKSIPKLVKKLMVKADKEEGKSSMAVKQGEVYVMESYNKIEFTAPDKIVQKVISVNSTFPESGENISPMDFITTSFYSSNIGSIAISPLSPQAFSYYRYKYLGATLQGNNTVNKIQVIPKMKSQQLFEGTIYIIEDLWCLHSLDLNIEIFNTKIRVQQIYIPVQDEIWLPVSYKFEFDFSMLGISFNAEYGGSIKYIDVSPNTSLHKPASVTLDYSARSKPLPASQNPVASQNQQKIEEILQKDQIKNKDMIKLSRLMKEESDETLPDSVRNNLEIRNNTTTTIEKDAGKKDSTYWAEIRPVPLSESEVRSIFKRDSARNEKSLQVIKNDSLPKNQQKNKSKFFKTLDNIAFGHTWSDTTGFRFNFNGLVNLKSISFNTVDGFTYGTDFRISKQWKNNKALTFAPQIRWAFSREKLMWRVNGNYSFNGMKQRSLFFRTGSTSTDISTGGSINPLLNTFTSLFLKKNYLKLYETGYFSAGYRTEIINGLNLQISAGYENRKVLANTTSFSFIKSDKEYSVNIPDNEYLAAGSNPLNALRNQKHFEIVTNVTFTPRQKYSIYKNAKAYRGSDWPTFGLSWEHGINEFSEMTDKYRHLDLIKLDISRYRQVGAFSEFRWRIITGGFLNNKYLTWYDFVHFNTQPLPLLLDDYQDAFRLLSYYSLSTPEFFGEAHLKYTTPYLLLKLIPGVSNTLIRENLSLSYLGSRFHTSYTEIGYSITGMLRLLELGIYAGFDDIKYRSIGARLIVKIN